MAKTVKEKEVEKKDITLAVVQQVTKLATSGFSLVAALAWNNVIQETVNNYIKPYISKDSGLVSLFLYAIIITVLAVTITVQLATLEEKMTLINRKVKNKIYQVKNRK